MLSIYLSSADEQRTHPRCHVAHWFMLRLCHRNLSELRKPWLQGLRSSPLLDGSPSVAAFLARSASTAAFSVQPTSQRPASVLRSKVGGGSWAITDENPSSVRSSSSALLGPALPLACCEPDAEDGATFCAIKAWWRCRCVTRACCICAGTPRSLLNILNAPICCLSRARCWTVK